MNNTINGLSAIIPTYNEEKYIIRLLQYLDKAIPPEIKREYIFVDDISLDKTREYIAKLADKYPISLHVKRGKRGKALSLQQGFSQAKYDYICTIDVYLLNRTPNIPFMIKKIESGADIVVINGARRKNGLIRDTLNTIHQYIFNHLFHGFNFDVYCGLKIFKKEIMERITLDTESWEFDLEFLYKARNAGYRIDIYDVIGRESKARKRNPRFFSALLERTRLAFKLKIDGPQSVPQKKGLGFHYKGALYIPHSELPEEKTALYRLSQDQILILTLLSINIMLGLIIDWKLTFTIILAVLTVIYFADLLFNLYLVFRSFSKAGQITITDAELDTVDESEWPMYTVFCPLYKEWQVVPQFMAAMSRLDYPKDKLQVMLLLEENDTETIQQIQNYNLPDYFETVIVPHSLPKTKPKALNYGMFYTKGEYIVIYDAEDVPDPLQLKKVILAFKNANRKVICIQSKLNFYNPHQNLLTKLFTAEYSLWFDLVLTGLQSIDAPIPLGGTSNHFRTIDLIRLKGWDSFNVTEDCDLGIRLVKSGYRTGVLDSVTLEEANSDAMNWFWQRTRWIKGYIQTYLLHMRRPSQFLSSWREPHVITFQLVVGGKIMSMFINPLMWIITISYFAFRAHVGLFIEQFFPAPVLYMAVISLVIGNFLYMYYYMIGCARHGHHELVKYMYVVPFYWLAMSLAAWVAVYKFIQNPHYWSKTVHGLHLKNAQSLDHATVKMGRGLVDVNLAS